jgi:hypothetical protein
MQRKLQMPMLDIRADVNPENINEGNRTVDLVWSAGSRVMRSANWWTGESAYFEELSMEAAHIRMDRFDKGVVPLLDTHSGWSLSSQLGIAERGWLENGTGKATVKFSSRDDVKPIFQDVKDKIIRSVSVGYKVYKYEDVTPKATPEVPNPTRVLRAVDWEPFEISLVPIPADMNASVRSDKVRQEFNEVVISARNAQEEMQMKTTETAPVVTGANDEQIRKEALAAGKKAEAERQSEIRKLVRSVKLDESFSDELISGDKNIDEARAAIIDKLAEKSDAAPQVRGANPSVVVTQDETVNHRASIQEALLHRVDPSKHKLTELGRPFAHMRMLDMYREHARVKGLDVRGMGPMQLAERAFHSTSDFANILADSINKKLRDQYEGAPKTFAPFCRQASAPDFKTMSRVQLSDFPSLTSVNEHGEFKFYSMSDGKEQYSLATYGARVGLTRQAMINDDLSAFSRIPGMVGQSAADLESDIVWAIITANANLADGGALFNATALTTAGGHANLTSSGTAISVDSLGVGKKQMRLQKSLQGRLLNLVPGFLIVPAAKETIAQQFQSNSYVASESGKINPFAGQLQLIVEPRLDANSATAWYMAAQPGRVDTIEYCYLEGAEGVYTETKMGWEVDGMEIKVRHDFAAKAIDFRGLYKNNGA